MFTDLLDLEQCQSQLRAHYNTMSQVKITPWDPDDTVDIDNMYTTLSWLKDEKKPSGKTQRKLEDYPEMFEGHKRFVNPKRMLVYGRPGIGKSTFSQKIAVDWTNGEKEALKTFDLLLLVKLRDVCGIQELPSIIKASKLLTKDGSVSIDSLYEYVLQHQDNVLLVFDGYDEYSAGESSPIREIWEGNQLRDCHVVMTTREMEGEELIKYSHVQCEIRGFDSKEQVNTFASTFITNPKEIDEFDRYLDSRDLWEIAEIPLLLLMLCLVWMDRHTEALPKSKLELHERFVKTLLLHMTIKDPKDSKGEHLDTILVDYREDLTEIGKLALDSLLRNVVYVDLKDSKLKSSRRSINEKMIRSGLFQFSKLVSGEPNEKLFFLHKSVQEFLASWYIMNEAGLKEGKVDCFINIDSFKKVLHLQEILKLMSEWSEEGAKAVFSLLKYIGGKEELTECHLTEAPSGEDLSREQRNFRFLTLECLLACSASSKQAVYSTFLSSVSGIVSLNSTLNAQKLVAENQLLSTTLPSYIFLNFPYDAKIISILDALNAVIIARSGRRLNASKYFGTHRVYSSDRKAGKVWFFLRKEGEVMCLYFTHICIVDTLELFEMLKDLAASFPESEKKQLDGDVSNDKVNTGNSLNVSENTGNTSYYKKQNCLSLVKEIFLPEVHTSEELNVISNVLSAVEFPKSVLLRQLGFRLFDAQVVKNIVSHISITDHLSILILNRLNLSANDVTVIVSSLHCAPNLEHLNLSNSPLYGSVNCLADSLRHVPRLIELKLIRVGMGNQECESLATSLKHVPKLETLCLMLNPLGSGIIKLAENLKSVPCLKELWLSRTNLGEEEVTALAHALTCVPDLQRLYVDENPLGRGVSVLIQNFSSFPNRRKLNLQGVVMTEKQLDDLANANRRSLIVTSYYVSIFFTFVFIQ